MGWTDPKLPPRIPEWLLRRALPIGFRGMSIVGDLREEFDARVERFGGQAARRWYWRQVLGVVSRTLVPPLFNRRTMNPDGPGCAKHEEWRGGGGDFMDKFVQDFRYAVRGLVRAPTFTLVAVATLALGIGANTAVFSLINGVLLKPLPIADQDRVVQIYTSDFSSGLFGSSSHPDFLSFRDGAEGFDGMASFSFSMPINVSTSGVADRMNGMLVSGDFFNVLGIRPALGRLFGPSDDETPGGHPVTVLSYATWQTRFAADPQALGETVMLNGFPFEVIGVTPEQFTGLQTGVFPDLYLPTTMFGQAFPRFASFPVLEARGARWLGLVGRLSDGVTVEQVEAQLTSVMTGLAEEFPNTNLGTLQAPDRPRPITVRTAHEAALGPNRAAAVGRAQMLMTIVGMVLLITCANVANLLVARANRRRREVAVRLALGAGRRRIAGQMLTESLLLSALGGSLGLGLAFMMSRVLMPLGLPTVLQNNLAVPEVPLDGPVLLFAVAITVITGLVFGVVPALHATRPNLVPALKEGEEARKVGGGPRLREALVVFQVAGSLVLLVGSAMFVQSALQAYRIDLGFDAEGVGLVTLDPSRQGMDTEEARAFYRDLGERIAGLPGVTSYSISSAMPVQVGGARTSFEIEGFTPPVGEDGQPMDMEFNFNTVSPGFFETLRVPIVQGRSLALTDDRPDAPQVAVVNQTFADLIWPGENAVGKRMRFPGTNATTGAPSSPWMEVVGVTTSGKYRNVREAPLPYVFLPTTQGFSSVYTLAVRTGGEVDALFPAIRREVQELESTMPVFDVRTLSDHVALALAQERSTATMISVLGGLALALAAVGLYGILAFQVSQRTREIGIRTALGAHSGNVVRLILAHGVRLTLLGLFLGAGASVALNRLASGFVVGISAWDPVTLGGSALVLGAASLLAAYLPARRATKVNPVIALRTE